ncbi:MAG TPA: hypothetical protein VFK47_23315 [Ktedonobacteraceae bacterium]|nr:hypothetical protein [Ktedonobacteraceae bacterium]
MSERLQPNDSAWRTTGVIARYLNRNEVTALARIVAQVNRRDDIKMGKMIWELQGEGAPRVARELSDYADRIARADERRFGDLAGSPVSQRVGGLATLQLLSPSLDGAQLDRLFTPMADAVTAELQRARIPFFLPRL